MKREIGILLLTCVLLTGCHGCVSSENVDSNGSLTEATEKCEDEYYSYDKESMKIINNYKIREFSTFEVKSNMINDDVLILKKDIKEKPYIDVKKIKNADEYVYMLYDESNKNYTYLFSQITIDESKGSNEFYSVINDANNEILQTNETIEYFLPNKFDDLNLKLAVYALDEPCSNFTIYGEDNCINKIEAFLDYGECNYGNILAKTVIDVKYR